LNRLKNDELEKQVSVIAVGNEVAVKQHFTKLKNWQIKISDKEAINFGVIEMLVLIIIASSLIVSSKMFGATFLAGSLIGIYNYVLKFVSGLDTIPYTIQKITYLQDITQRIAIEMEDASVSTDGLSENKKIHYIQGTLKLSA
jgi:hypothetical protein